MNRSHLGIAELSLEHKPTLAGEIVIIPDSLTVDEEAEYMRLRAELRQQELEAQFSKSKK